MCSIILNGPLQFATWLELGPPNVKHGLLGLVVDLLGFVLAGPWAWPNRHWVRTGL